MIDEDFFKSDIDDVDDIDSSVQNDDIDFDIIEQNLNSMQSDEWDEDEEAPKPSHDDRKDEIEDFFDNYGEEDDYDFALFGGTDDADETETEKTPVKKVPINKTPAKKAPVKKTQTKKAQAKKSTASRPAVNTVKSAKAPVKSTASAKKKKKRKSKKSSILLCAVLVFCALIIGASSIISDIFSEINYQPLEHTWEDTVADAAPDIPLYEDDRYYNVLLIGADGSLEGNVRSDTMMLVSVDRKKHKIRLVSFLRDSFIQIPGHGKNRLNASFAFGGPQLLMQTLEANYRVKIDKYMCVGFGNLEAIVDCMGGVDMELTDAEAKYINRYALKGSKTLTGGMQHLNGNEALNFAQIRKLDSDFGRTNRQRRLIEEIVHESVAKGPVQLLKIVKQASGYLTTNMSKTELTRCGLLLMLSSRNSFEELHLPVDDGYSSQTIDGMAVLVPDIPKNCRVLHHFLFEEDKQQQ